MSAKTIIRLLAVVGFFCCSSAPARAQFRWAEVGPRAAFYQIYVGTTPIGKARFLVKPLTPAAEDTFQFTFQIEGIFNQKTQVTFLKRPDLRPVHSVFESLKTGSSIYADYAYSPEQISGTLTRRGPVEKTQEIRLAAPDGVIDIGLLRYALSLLPLEPMKAVKFPIFDVRDGKVLKGRGWVSRIDEVEVPAGRFRCYRVELFAGSAQEISFIEIRPPHRLIRQLYPSQDVDVKLIQD